MSRVIPIGESKNDHYTLRQTSIEKEDFDYIVVPEKVKISSSEQGILRKKY
jgi:hypothetical protein